MGWFFPLLCTATWGAGQPPVSLGCSSLLPRDVATRPRCPHGSRCQRSHGEGTWPVGDAVGAVPLPPADSGPVLLRDAAWRCARGRDAAEMRPPGWKGGEEREKREEKRPHGLARSTKPWAVFKKRGFGAVNEQRSSRGSEWPRPRCPSLLLCAGASSARGALRPAPRPGRSHPAWCWLIRSRGRRWAAGGAGTGPSLQDRGTEACGQTASRVPEACWQAAETGAVPEWRSLPGGSGLTSSVPAGRKPRKRHQNRAGSSLCSPGLSSGEAAARP